MDVKTRLLICCLSEMIHHYPDFANHLQISDESHFRFAPPNITDERSNLLWKSKEMEGKWHAQNDS